MKYVKRLQCGDDLKKEIEQLFSDNNLSAAIVVCAVGCLKEVNIRLAGGSEFLNLKEDFEIISLTGTISLDGSHIHIGLADRTGKAIGGHLCYNCIVNTTCELVIESVDNYQFNREVDLKTGYKELVIKEK